MGVFAGIDDKVVEEATPMERTDRLPEGLHVIRMNSVKFSLSTNKANRTDGWPMVNAEFTVLESTNADTPSGSTRSVGFLIDNGSSGSSRDAAALKIGELKSLIAAVLGGGKTYKDITATGLEKIKNNPLALEGKKAIIEVGASRKTKGGHDFEPRTYHPYSDEMSERVKKSAKVSAPAKEDDSTKVTTGNTPPRIVEEEDAW